MIEGFIGHLRFNVIVWSIEKRIICVTWFNSPFYLNLQLLNCSLIIQNLQLFWITRNAHLLVWMSLHRVILTWFNSRTGVNYKWLTYLHDIYRIKTTKKTICIKTTNVLFKACIYVVGITRGGIRNAPLPSGANILLLASRKLYFIEHASFVCVCVCVCTHISVSYTHLDVYKRQAYRLANLWMRKLPHYCPHKKEFKLI